MLNLKCVGNLFKFYTRRGTRRTQTTLAKADHYPHNAQYKQYALMNVGPWRKANIKGSRSLPAPRSEHATTMMSFFSYLLI